MSIINCSDSSGNIFWLRMPPPIKTRLALTLPTGPNQNLGWARLEKDGAVSYGVHHFRGGGAGMMWHRFRNWLDIMRNESRPVSIVFAEVSRFPYPNKSKDAEIFYGFVAHLKEYCKAHKIECRGIPLDKVKDYVTGRRDVSKHVVATAITSLGYEPNTHNDASAIATLLYQRSECHLT